MQEFSPGTLHHWDQERQEAVLQQALGTVPSRDAGSAVRQLLSQGGCLLVLLGQFLRARESAKEIVAHADLVDETARLKAIRVQGQLGGIDLCIDLMFDLVNFEENEDGSERRRTNLSGNSAV